MWQMNGSYSIKEVLPALVPEMDYEKLEISNGGMAMSAYFEMSAAKDQLEVNRIRKDLFEYCGMDTLAMVKIVDQLRIYAGNS